MKEGPQQGGKNQAGDTEVYAICMMDQDCCQYVPNRPFEITAIDLVLIVKTFSSLATHEHTSCIFASSSIAISLIKSQTLL